MCKVMQTVEISEKDSKASFRIFLINKCQQQFERDKAEELDVIKKQEEIQTCTDPVSRRNISKTGSLFSRVKKIINPCKLVSSYLRYKR